MPTYSGNLVGTTVGANYLQLTSQDTYADGSYYSNFGTRSLKAILINKSTAGSSADMTKGADGAAGTFKDSNSLLSRITRTVQQFAEVYYVGKPSSTDVIMLISNDTMNSANASSNTQSGGWGALEAALADSVNLGSFGSSGTAFTVTASTAADAGQIFVGNAVGTFA